MLEEDVADIVPVVELTSDVVAEVVGRVLVNEEVVVDDLPACMARKA
jgi:hypothetical protein